LADQTRNLFDEIAADDILPKYKSRNRDHDEQHRRQRGYSIKGNCGAPGQGLMRNVT
jgi:hypothetical protein